MPRKMDGSPEEEPALDQQQARAEYEVKVHGEGRTVIVEGDVILFDNGYHQERHGFSSLLNAARRCKLPI